MATPTGTPPKDVIVERLLESEKAGEALSGTTLAAALGMSRAAVGKHIRGLRDEGYGIDSAPGRGYTLNSVPDVPYPREVLRGLPKDRLIPGLAFYQDAAVSTNAEAKMFAEAGARDGTVIVAGTQRKGRGRLSRSWSSPRGGIWLSVVLRPNVPPAAVQKLVLLTGSAVCAALEYEANINAGLKWPNDVLVDERKLCGILAEASMEIDRVHYVVMGVGLNYDFPLSKLPKDLRESAVTARALVDRELAMVPMVRRLLKELDERYRRFCREAGGGAGGRVGGKGKGGEEGDPGGVIAEWRERSATLGRRVRVETPSGTLEGTAVDIDAGGRLVVQTRKADVTVSAGDCVHLR